MGEKIGHRAAAKVPKPPPAIVFLETKRLIGRATQPPLPVKRLSVDRLRNPAHVVVLPPVRPHLRHAPKASTLDQINRIAEVRPAALLHPALQNLLARPDSMGQRRALFKRVRNRLLKIHIFPGSQSVDRHAHMPVVGRGNKDSVDLLLQDLVIVDMRGGRPLERSLTASQCGP